MPPKAEKQLVANIVDDTAPQYAMNPDNYRMGSLVNIQLNHRAELQPVGNWNAMEVAVQNGSVQIKVNGKETTAISLDDPMVAQHLGHAPAPSGRIALQACIGTVRFRNIEVKELRPSTLPAPPALPPPPKISPMPPPAPTVVYQPVGEFRSLLTRDEILTTKHTGDPNVSRRRNQNGEILFNLTDAPKQRQWMQFNRDYADFPVALAVQAHSRGQQRGRDPDHPGQEDTGNPGCR